MSKFAALVVFGLIVLAAALTGIMYEPGAWYAALNKPAWTPPNWAFPVAWTILYVMIAIAGWLVWCRNGMSAALAVWAGGLVLNAAWSVVMFGHHNIGLALADLGLLWVATLAFIAMSWRIDRRAAWLFVPYLLWISFAGALNYEVWLLNPPLAALPQ